ncbi:dipeptide ABC transporter ATP-binding protein [Nioella sp.]|uniref:dipeptide ABC transporter ATP-binding protein n=1 Tax=Nioella sp. TaxID=1912091 RepID=UPI003A88DCAA
MSVTSSPPVLQVSGYSLSYETPNGSVDALQDIDLSIPHGRTLGLVGESGSGKSSLAWSILRYLPGNARENDGQIMLSGENLRDRSPREILEIRGRRISMVFQDPSTSLNPTMKLGEQLQEVLIRHRGLTPQEARDESEAALARTGITHPGQMMRRYPHEASGGEKQRVVIAAAFACDPELIVFDEPTTALDIITAQAFLELFNKLQEETGVSALYISHDLGLVSKVADDVAVINKGRIVETGACAKVFRSPQDPYSRQLIDAVPNPTHWLGTPRPPADAPRLLSAKGISVEYNRQTRLGKLLGGKPSFIGAKNVNLDVRKGELLGVVGESGSGKSTMAKVLSGLQEFDGTVQLGERDFTSRRQIDRAYRRAVQIVFQHPDASLNPRQRIREILNRPLKLYDIVPRSQRRARIAELLEQVLLPAEFADRFPHELSGGEKQRVAIARAFAAEPEVVICDEITASLDVSVQASVARLLVDLQRETGTSCLFITHDLNLVRQLAHRICVMQHGTLVDSFHRDDALAPDRHPYTQALLEAVPLPTTDAA